MCIEKSKPGEKTVLQNLKAALVKTKKLYKSYLAFEFFSASFLVITSAVLNILFNAFLWLIFFHFGSFDVYILSQCETIFLNL